MVVRFPGPTGRVVRSLWAMGSLAKQVMDRKFAIRSFPFFCLFVQPLWGGYSGVFGPIWDSDDSTRILNWSKFP